MENGPRGASARATSSKRSAPRSNQADQLASRGTRHGDQSTRSNGPEAKLKREEVEFDGQWEQGEFDGDVQMDGAWVPYYGKTDSAVACSSERPDQFESSYPTRTAVSQATVGAVYRKPVELGGGSTARREKRTTKLYEPHQRSDDDDVTITSATVVPTRNDPWDQSKTHDLTSGGDAAIAWALQEEEEKKKVKISRKKPSKRPTSSSSPPPSASTQDDLVARDYEIALRLQESLDKEMAASLQTEGADFMSYAGAEGMHNPRLHYGKVWSPPLPPPPPPPPPPPYINTIEHGASQWHCMISVTSTGTKPIGPSMYHCSLSSGMVLILCCCTLHAFTLPFVLQPPS